MHRLLRCIELRCVGAGQVRYFKHNDLADLERVLLDVAAEDRRVRCASISATTGLLSCTCTQHVCIASQGSGCTPVACCSHRVKDECSMSAWVSAWT